MAWEEAWAKARELAREMSRAWQEELSLRPYPQLGQAMPMTPDETKALRDAEEKHVEVAKAYQKAAEEALRLNRLH